MANRIQHVAAANLTPKWIGRRVAFVVDGKSVEGTLTDYRRRIRATPGEHPSKAVITGVEAFVTGDIYQLHPQATVTRGHGFLAGTQ